MPRKLHQPRSIDEAIEMIETALHKDSVSIEPCVVGARETIRVILQNLYAKGKRDGARGMERSFFRSDPRGG